MSYRRVVLAIPYSREALIGISEYLRTHKRWRIDPASGLAETLDRYSWGNTTAEGVVIQALSRPVAQAAADLPVPVVSISDDGFDDLLPTICCDNVAIGHMGAEHLIERGFHELVFFGSLDRRYARLRWEGFREVANERGLQAQVIDASHLERVWPRQVRDKVGEKLMELPKPAGVMCDNDVSARFVARTCLEMGLSVPEEIAILGVDNDEVMCDLDLVPLSSIQPDMERIGYEAAALLDRMMAEGKMKIEPRLIPPKGVVTRQSTDVVAVEDTVVAQACRFIRDHAAENITVEQVAEVCALSRRSLDRRFKQAIDRSPADEILMVRLDKARDLLRDTSLHMPQVAELCGFTDLNHLGRCFRRRFDVSPTAYRRKYQMAVQHHEDEESVTAES